MSFTSVFFLLGFLPVVLTASLFHKSWWKNLILFIASLFFYSWGSGALIFILLAVILINYGFGLWIGSDIAKKGKCCQWKLVFGISINLLFLCLFKYTFFLCNTLNTLAGYFGINAIQAPQIPSLLGISFFTFQSLSYLIDIARGEAPPQKYPFYLSLHLMMFPKIIAGPIVQYRDIHQYLNQRDFHASDLSEGARRLIVGLGKKLLVADIIALKVNEIYSLPPTDMSFTLAWLAALLYSLQIFFDFAGYSDMAIGLGRMFGFRFMENFNYPYVSTSVREFWQRWHISLSTWFKDYLYVPLGGNRHSSFRTYFNLFIVFFLCGLWHGPSWTFVLWGFSHGFLIILERIGSNRLSFQIPRPLKHLYLLAAITITWILFRSESLLQASYMLKAIIGFAPVANSFSLIMRFINGEVILAIVFGIIASTPLFQRISNLTEKIISRSSTPCRIGIHTVVLVLYGALLFLCLLAVAGSTHSPFIYAKF